MKGFVNRFDRKKGYGFITTAEGDDLFFHLKDCSNSIFSVEFDIEECEKGLRAIKIKKTKTQLVGDKKHDNGTK